MNAPHNPEMQAVLGMTADTIGKDLLSALVQEVRLMPDVWPKLAEQKQQDIIDRLRKRVETNVRMACHLIASTGRSVVVGDLESVAIKDGIKATFKVSPGNECRHSLFDSVWKACLLVVADASQHIGGMDEVQADPNQSPLDLGGEDGQEGESDVIEGEVLGLPSPTPDHEGDAAEDPIYQDAVKVIVAEQKVSTTFLQRHFRIGYNRAARLIEQMEADGIVSAPDANGGRMVLKDRDAE
jgi:hypothetical protein